MARLVWLKDELLKAANDEIKNTKRESWEDEPKLIPNMQIYHYHNDHLGTPNELTNQKGEVVWLADYEAWGNTAKVVWREEKLEQLQVSADELQPIRFQGQYYDEETGLHYNRFRYFDPDLGMFTSRDSIGLMGGVNTFQYAPNPTGWIDPFGLAKQTPNNCDCDNGCPSGTMNPSKIHFMQSSAKNTTGDYTVLGNTKSLSTNSLDANVLRVKIWKDTSGKIWSLDHRRLAAFKISKKCVPYTWATPAEVKSQMWKMTTKNGGTSIRIKMADGKLIIVK